MCLMSKNIILKLIIESIFFNRRMLVENIEKILTNTKKQEEIHFYLRIVFIFRFEIEIYK